MSRTYKDSPQRKLVHSRNRRGQQHNISVRAVRREPPDYRKLARAAIALAMAKAEADAAKNQTGAEAPDGR